MEGYPLIVERFDPENVNVGDYAIVVSRGSVLFPLSRLQITKKQSDGCICIQEDSSGAACLKIFYKQPGFYHLRVENDTFVLGVPQKPDEGPNQLTEVIIQILQAQRQ